MTTTEQRITVRRVYRGYPFTIQNSSVRVERAWRVHGTDNDLFVVDSRWGLTIVDYAGWMVTSWHVGIGPGDLARLKLNA